MSDYPQRTDAQNRSAHLFFRQVADELNNAGYERRITIGTADVPWSAETVKALFKKIGRFQFNKGKTSEMTTKEITEVYDTFNRMLSEEGVHIPWPSIDELLTKKEKI